MIYMNGYIYKFYMKDKIIYIIYMNDMYYIYMNDIYE